jgi:hypothetical protein
MLTTTLRAIREHDPCAAGWRKLLAHLGKTKADDEPLPFHVLLESNGLDDALWACRSAPQYDREWRLFAVWCARQVQHLMADPRSVAALDVAERFANGEATKYELDAAGAAAWAVRVAAWVAAWAAGAAAMAAGEVAAMAVRDTAWDAAWAASIATARAASIVAARAAQKARFLEVVGVTGDGNG